MRIDLNADIGEGVVADGVDTALLGCITSANIACGFHGGDPGRMWETSRLAALRDVRIGAHVSYWDRRNFGRTETGRPPESVKAEIAYQIGALRGCAALDGALVSYVKPHGALYGRCHRDAEMATTLADAVALVDPTLAVMAPPGSCLQSAAEARGLTVIVEGFIDRRYQANGELEPRSRDGAVLDWRSAEEQARQIIVDGSVTARNGTCMPMRVDSLCIHSDTPSSVRVARRVRRLLDAAAGEGSR